MEETAIPQRPPLNKVYLAIPYTGMQQSSYEQATFATAYMISNNKQLNIFSPITHSHPLTKFDSLDVPGTWDYWEQVDYQYLDWADQMIVIVPQEGLDKVFTSTGVMAELEYAKSKNMPITFYKWDLGTERFIRI
jgi:hypothetical protein